MPGELLYQQVIIDKWKKGHSVFFGKYKNINSSEALSQNTIALFNLQLTRLRMYEQQVQQLNFLKPLNQFIFSAPNQKIEFDTRLKNNLESSKLIQRLIEILNASLKKGSLREIYWGAKGKTRLIQDNKIREKALNNLALELKEISKNLKLSESVQKQLLETFWSRFNDNGGISEKKGFSTKDYANQKGQLIENILVDFLINNCGLEAIQTGQLTKDGQALIQDAIISTGSQRVQQTNNFLNWEIKSTNLIESGQDIIKKLENLKNKSTVITVENNLYNLLDQGAIIGGQAKSGINQNILTKAIRNNISFQELLKTNKNFEPYLLLDLYYSYPKCFNPNMNSLELEKIANYNLSKAIAYTALTKNQVYLTEQGFTTASGWMALTKKMLVFQPPVRKLTNGFFREKRPIRFVSIQ